MKTNDRVRHRSSGFEGTVLRFKKPGYEDHFRVVWDGDARGKRTWTHKNSLELIGSNQLRAQRAKATLNHYKKLIGESGQSSDEDFQDLMTDVFHWLNSEPATAKSTVDKEEMLQMVVHAWASYKAEIKGK